MSKDFKGTDLIYLEPHTASIPRRFKFDIASSAEANDGALAYDTTISSVTIVESNEDGTTVSGIVDSYIVADDYIDVVMSYPSGLSEGRYKITFIITATDGSVDEFNFPRIEIFDQ